MYNAIVAPEIKQIIGKVNLNLESLIAKMNSQETLTFYLETNHGNGQLGPINFDPDDYESPNEAFESDYEDPDDVEHYTEIERRGYDAHIISNSLVFAICEQAIKLLSDLAKRYGENIRISIAISCNSRNTFSFWQRNFVDHDVKINFNPHDGFILNALDYAFDGKYDCFSFLNPNDNLLHFGEETDDFYAIVFDCYHHEGNYKIQNTVVAKVLD